MIQTERLTEKIQLMNYSVSATTFGAVQDVYKPIRTMYVTKLNQRGNRNFDGNLNTYNDQISFYARYVGNLDKKSTRILYNCEYYEIINLTHDKRSTSIIDCVAVK